MKILMICLGNICRSPLAEGILRDKINRNNLEWEVDSAGTSGWHNGELPDSRSINVALENGIDITGQRSRKIRSIDIDNFDLLLVMDEKNKQDVLKYCQNEIERKKVIKIMSFTGQQSDVPDPYFGEFGFENVFNMLDEACEYIIKNYM
ncbi:low molecular weight protein-tyrosine-phosphatase [Membranihabitans maritimus]|uniref:low molecular weight protein-tyrosine-phosphatase n=1 Tax=Membranihabitans maritimus TaxID=2904244 RepID=UPI001F23AB5A|nr:low molecular weight protein-tyrosine-phosphatase [Membranihabitans maritimus]